MHGDSEQCQLKSSSCSQDRAPKSCPVSAPPPPFPGSSQLLQWSAFPHMLAGGSGGPLRDFSQNTPRAVEPAAPGRCHQSHWGNYRARLTHKLPVRHRTMAGPQGEKQEGAPGLMTMLQSQSLCLPFSSSPGGQAAHHSSGGPGLGAVNPHRAEHCPDSAGGCLPGAQHAGIPTQQLGHLSATAVTRSDGLLPATSLGWSLSGPAGAFVCT